jgi:acetyl/propionyl-CoA carboxylase alpha subunit
VTQSALPKRLFIANRGEIARRIALTARRLGIQTVILTDRETLPKYLAGIVSHAVRVEQESPALYLDGAAMIRHAREAGCDSVHPGFGFLSEHAGFAAMVVEAGLIWVGPKPAAIAAMASKASARGYAERAGVPCVKGISKFNVPTEIHGDFTELEAFAREAGYPLLMKAAFGGGGKGMRVVQQHGELREAALRAASEAKSSFGDGSLICEQYLGAPRHIEVQILADRLGHVVAVGDRDCSLQRRHQKIIEEAPATGLTAATRRELHAAAIALAQAVGYDSTGTVEFLIDWSDSARQGGAQRFYFLEMNTRLQVEHPVTEEVFGIDLVEWQLRVAAGEALPAAFEGLQPRGHSVEARLYTEDVDNGFFPAPGPVASFKPALGPGLRWEIGLDEVDEVTGRFDPMIAKLVATGPDRPAALARLADGLNRTFFAGPANNLDLIGELVTHTRFATEPVTTQFLGTEIEPILRRMKARHQADVAAAEQLLDALVAGRLAPGAAVRGGNLTSLTQQVFQLRPADRSPPYDRAHQPCDARPQLHSSSYTSPGPGVMTGQTVVQSGEGVIHAADGSVQAFAYAMLAAGSDRTFWTSFGGCTVRRQVLQATRRQHGEQHKGGQATVTAPVPGRVIAVKVEARTPVAAGDTMFVLESMKMEFEVRATEAGELSEVHVKSNDQVTAGQLLAKWAR